MFSVAQGGALSQVAGSPFATGAQPSALAFSPVVSGNEFLGVTNYGDNTLSMFKVDQSTGAATEVAGSPFATGAGPYSVAFSPVVSGNEFVAVSDSNDNTMSIYQVDQSTGAATPVVGSPFATGDQPYSVAFSPVVSGNLFLAVTNYGANTASVYQVNQTTGAATEVAGSPFATGDGPYFGAFSPVVGGNVLFATADQEASQVSMFELDQSTGAVTPVAGSPFDAGAGPDQLAFNAGGNLLAVANFNDSTASVFAVSPTGAVSQVTGSPYPTGDAPDGVAFSPDGSDENLLATANFSGGDGDRVLGRPPLGHDPLAGRPPDLRPRPGRADDLRLRRVGRRTGPGVVRRLQRDDLGLGRDREPRHLDPRGAHLLGHRHQHRRPHGEHRRVLHGGPAGAADTAGPAGAGTGLGLLAGRGRRGGVRLRRRRLLRLGGRHRGPADGRDRRLPPTAGATGWWATTARCPRSATPRRTDRPTTWG